jgi:hypothetical protein
VSPDTGQQGGGHRSSIVEGVSIFLSLFDINPECMVRRFVASEK